MNANTQKTSENNASPSPAPVRQSQNKLRLMAEKSGFDCDEIVANINASVVDAFTNPATKRIPSVSHTPTVAHRP